MDQPVSVVTGASSGIGMETARGLAARGHRVIAVGRDAERLRAAVEDIRRSTGNNAVFSMRADFSSLAEVRSLADALVSELPRVDVLVNNAALWNRTRRLSRDGFEETFAVNHLAPYVLTRRLLPALRASAGARIVNVASSVHYSVRHLELEDLAVARSFRGIVVYSRSKLATVIFSNELARRLERTPVTSNSLDPGNVQTNVTRDDRVLDFLMQRLAWLVLKTPQDGAKTSLYLATAPELGGVSGHYFVGRKERAPNRLARDPAIGSALFRLSADLTGESYPPEID